VAVHVVDCAVILAWALEENGPDTSLAALERLATHGAVVPGLWPLEIGNALLTALRQKRLTPQRFDILANIKELRVDVDRRTNDFALTRILSLARRHNLITYDATYLELAARSGLALATYDRELADAANCRPYVVRVAQHEGLHLGLKLACALTSHYCNCTLPVR
jgi:predicted nucleic acid-binding protein